MSLDMGLESILYYSDYKAYLKDYLNHKKENVPGFSLRSFSKQVGIKSQSFLSMVINGKRELGLKTFKKISPHLDISEAEKDYLLNLVLYNQAETESEKSTYSQKLNLIATEIKKVETPYQLTESDQAALIWTDTTVLGIYGILVQNPLRNDPISISLRFTKTPSPYTIRKAIQKLVESGRVIIDNNYLTPNPDFVEITPYSTQISPEILAGVQKEFIENYREYFENIPFEKRILYNLPLTLNTKQTQRLRKKIFEFMRDIHIENNQSPLPNDREVYALNLHLAPITI